MLNTSARGALVALLALGVSLGFPLEAEARRGKSVRLRAMTFNIRFDSRRQIGRIALVSFLDVINLYNHLNVNEDRFLELTGKEDRRGFEILPTGGLKVEF